MYLVERNSECVLALRMFDSTVGEVIPVDFHFAKSLLDLGEDLGDNVTWPCGLEVINVLRHHHLQGAILVQVPQLGVHRARRHTDLL